MSVKVMSHIWEHASCKGGELLVLLALGDHAKDDGTDVYPSVANLAKKARISRRSVQYILRKFEAAGVLVLVANEGGGRGKAREYRLDLDAIERAQLACTLSDDKGRNGCAVSEPKGRNLEQERAQSATQKGAIAIAPESSGTVIEPLEEDISLRVRSLDALVIDDRFMDWVRENAPDTDPHGKLEDLRLYCRAKGKRYRDYRAALQQWLRREQAEINAGRSGKKLTAEQVRSERRAGFAAALADMGHEPPNPSNP